MSNSAQHKIDTIVSIQKGSKLKSLKDKLLFEIQKVLSYKREVPKEFIRGALGLLSSLKYDDIAEERNSSNICAYLYCESRSKDLGYAMKLLKYRESDEDRDEGEDEDGETSKNQFEEIMFCSQNCRTSFMKLREAVAKNEHLHVQPYSSFEFLECTKFETVVNLWQQLKGVFKERFEDTLLVKVKERVVPQEELFTIKERNIDTYGVNDCSPQKKSETKSDKDKEGEVVMKNYIGEIFDNGEEKFEIIEDTTENNPPLSKNKKEEEKKSKKALDPIEMGRQALTILATDLSASCFAKVYMWANDVTSNHDHLISSEFNKKRSVVIKTPAEQKLCERLWKSIEPHILSFLEHINLSQSLKPIRKTLIKIIYELELTEEQLSFTEEELKFIAKVLLKLSMMILDVNLFPDLTQQLSALTSDKESKEKEDVILDIFLSTN